MKFVMTRNALAPIRSQFPGLLFLALTHVLPVARLAAGEPQWPCYHGPQRNNHSTDQGLLTAWPAEGPPLVWTAGGIGLGYSSVAIADGRVFTGGMIKKQTFVTALDQNGKTIWQRPNGLSWEATKSQPWAVEYSGARGTPTVENDTVYHLSELGRLAAFDVRTGDERWHVELLQTFQGERPKYGLSESVLVHGNSVICCPGGQKGYAVALDKATGRTLWANTDIQDSVGYSSFVVARLDGVEQIVNSSARQVFALDPANGRLLWKYTFGNSRDNSATDTVVHDGHVFASCGYGGGSILLRPQRQPNGDFAVQEVWKINLMDNHHGGVLRLGDHLYGAGHEFRGWFCLDFKTGNQQWRSSGKGSLTYADGHLYCLDEKGTLSLVRAMPEKWTEVGSFTLPQGGRGQYWAHPVVCGGRLYVRHAEKLFVYDVHKKKP